MTSSTMWRICNNDNFSVLKGEQPKQQPRHVDVQLYVVMKLIASGSMTGTAWRRFIFSSFVMVCLSFYFCYFAYGRENLRIFHADRERHFRLPHYHAHIPRVAHQREVLAALFAAERPRVAVEMPRAEQAHGANPVRVMRDRHHLVRGNMHTPEEQPHIHPSSDTFTFSGVIPTDTRIARTSIANRIRNGTIRPICN